MEQKWCQVHQVKWASPRDDHRGMWHTVWQSSDTVQHATLSGGEGRGVCLVARKRSSTLLSTTASTPAVALLLLQWHWISAPVSRACLFECLNNFSQEAEGIFFQIETVLKVHYLENLDKVLTLEKLGNYWSQILIVLLVRKARLLWRF